LLHSPSQIFSQTKINKLMNKGDLIDRIAANAGVTKAQAGDALDAVLSGVEGSLKKGDRVTLVGFGTFSVSKRAARKGRNPRTGKEIKIKAKTVVRFKAGKQLSEKVNK
jgi:DNA-binding protein HU-beta